MAYVKHGTGPNDWKKGNRTKGKDRHVSYRPPKGTIPTNIEDLNNRARDMAETKAHYMEIAKSMDGVTKYGQEYAMTLHNNLSAYIEESREEGRPLTIADMILASGVSREVYYRMREGSSDWMLPSYMDRHGIPYDQIGTIYTDEEGQEILLLRLGDVIKQAELAIQADRERLCMDRNARNAAGAIFLLKAQQGLQDTPQDVVTHQSLTVNVASLDEAREALKRLE